MKLLRFFLAAGSALALLGASAQAIDYPVYADTAGSPVTTLLSPKAGRATSLPVSAKSSAYIYFGVNKSPRVPGPEKLKAARLILYVQKVTKPGALTVSLAGANELGQFTEVFPTGVKTQHIPAVGAPINVNPSANLDASLSKNFFIFDVTNEVFGWLASSTTEYGFAITGDSTVNALLGAKEGSGTGYPAVLELEVDQNDSNSIVSGFNGTFSQDVGATNGFFSYAVSGDRGFFGTDARVGSDASGPSLALSTNALTAEYTGGNSLNTNNLELGAPRGAVKISGRDGVAIGTTPMQAMLTVGFTNTASGDFPAGRYINHNIDLTNATWGGGAVSIYASGNLICTGVHHVSDARVKNILGRSDASTDLGTLRAIEITDYTHKDVIAKGISPVKKVIAQQVEKVFPQAVNKNTDVVPDIYQKATSKDGWVQLATDLKVGERVKLIGEKEEGIYAVLEVREGAFRTAFQPAGDQVFVFGREVADFRTVDYEAIAMLNVSATQELARKLDAKDAEIAALKATLGSVQAANLALAEKMAAFDRQLAALKADRDDRPARAVRASLVRK